MKIKVTVKANSRENSVTRIGNNEFQLRVKAPAKQGKTNEAVIDLLGELGYQGTPSAKDKVW